MRLNTYNLDVSQETLDIQQVGDRHSYVLFKHKSHNYLQVCQKYSLAKQTTLQSLLLSINPSSFSIYPITNNFIIS